MKPTLPLLCLLALAPAAWAQNDNRPAINPGNGPDTPRPSTVLSDRKLEQFGLVKPAEAAPLLAQYEAQEKQMLEQRQAAYVAMQDKSEEEQMRIWRSMVEAQKALLAEHRALEKRLGAALKDRREKAAADQRQNGKQAETR